MNVQPFRCAPDAVRVSDLQQRLALARRLPVCADPDGRLGIEPAALERLAQQLTHFDWVGFAARVNRHPAFTSHCTTEPLHFIHVPSAVPGAVPLLLLHGWPGSFLEFAQLIPELTQSAPAFHIICPSLPGFGFSARSLATSCNAAAMAERLASLMGELGYPRFLVQGGDWGSHIGAELARRHPARCLGLHLNFIAIRPPAQSDPVRAAVEPAESAWLAENARLLAEGMGYYAIQSTRPQTLAVALGDSPLGLLAWMGEKYLAWSDRDGTGASLISDAAILDQVALYWLTDSIGSSMRLYYDEAHAPSDQSYVEVPTGVAVFPRELLKMPRAWVHSASTSCTGRCRRAADISRRSRCRSCCVPTCAPSAPG